MDLLPEVINGTKRGYRRLAVDVAQTGFFEGREFRAFFEFNIPAGETRVLRFTSPVDFILFEQSLVVDSGSIRFSAVALDGIPSGSYNVSIPVIGKNRMRDRAQPYYISQVAIDTGGQHSGGQELEVIRVVAAGSSAQESSVGGIQATERGLPAGTFYLRLNNFGNSSATGVYSLFWEERP